jgi:Trypsin-like peptidase domain
MLAKLTPSEQLTHSTVRIECLLSDGTKSTGTGFFFRCLENGERHAPVLVTNKHVVAGAEIGRFNLTLMNRSEGPDIGKHFCIELNNFQHLWIPHPDPNVDLCVLPVAELLTKAATAGHRFFYVALDKTLLPSDEDLANFGALEDVIMIGYPNGIWDAANNLPILRRGITASHPNLSYEGRREFMIDAACFPGSSGSPIFLYNMSGWIKRTGEQVLGGVRIRLLGVLYAGPQHTATGEIRIVNVPTQQRALAISTIPNNLGLVVKSSYLLDFDDLVHPH